MAGCGYICPVCEGRGRLDDGTDCGYCQGQAKKIEPIVSELDRAQWVAQVHEGSCCADPQKY